MWPHTFNFSSIAWLRGWWIWWLSNNLFRVLLVFLLFHPPCTAFYPRVFLSLLQDCCNTSWKLTFTRQCLKQEKVFLCVFCHGSKLFLESVSPLSLPRIFSDLLLSGHYGLNICAHFPRSRFICQKLNPSVKVPRDEALGRWLGYEGRPLLNEISALIKETP